MPGGLISPGIFLKEESVKLKYDLSAVVFKRV
jgi:hypothetical protein